VRRLQIAECGVRVGATALFVMAFMFGLFAAPLAAQAQQPERIRRIGVLHYLQENDLEGRRYVAAFQQALQELGWIVDRNVRIDYRWTGGDANLIRKYADDLVALAPDVILAAGGSHVGPLQQVTRTVPIVFVQVADAVGGGFVNSLARPGGNATGFTNFEFNISAKWLELLKQIAPRMTRTAVLRDPANPSGTGQFGSIQAVAPSFGVEVSPIGLHDAAEIEHGITTFASAANGGLIVTPSGLAIVHRELIIALAARYRLPATYPFRYFVTSGGLISYGPDVVDQYRRAAGYVDRILKGEKPANLPVQQSTKVDMVINLKTAKALGLTIPQSILLRADEVIQ
jgi:putative tryptophan/tyrosine transport system substrate-binding protein